MLTRSMCRIVLRLRRLIHDDIILYYVPTFSFDGHVSIYTVMVRPWNRRLLDEAYIARRIAALDEALTIDRRVKLFEDARVLIEAINPEQFQAYLAWFKQVKWFLRQYKLPTLRKALEFAQDEVQDLMRGNEQGPSKGVGGMLKRMTGMLSGETGTHISRSAAGDMKRLNDVNHFLWGVTTFVSRIPIILSGVDDRLEGKLFGGEMQEADV